MSWLYSFVFASLLLSSSGDIPAPKAPPVPLAPPAPPSAVKSLLDETEVFERSYPLNANGRLSVSNVNGSIVVEAWDRNEVKLTATKVADSREALANVEVKVDARPDHFSVEAEYNRSAWRDRGAKLEVQFRLSVPRTAMLNEVETVNGSVTVSDFVNSTKVSAVNGNVVATNLRGAANLSTVNGAVAAEFDRLEAGTKVNLSTVNGRVNLIIPSDSNATIKADSLNGGISNEFGLPVRKGEFIGRDLHGRLGSGDVQIRLNSVNGPLAINRRKDGKNPSTPTNLLQKGGSSDDWDDDGETRGARVDAAKVDREVARAMKEANKASVLASKEMAKATQELKNLKLDKLDIDVDVKDLELQINEGLKAQAAAMIEMREAMWISPGPSVERKTNSFPVKGTPKVVIDAGTSNVKVRGWDKQEVKYVLTELTGRRSTEGAQIVEEQKGSTVNLKVVRNGTSIGRLPGEGTGTRIEVFVPRKSDLKIKSEGEIRLEGVSGEIDLEGGDEAIDVRGSDGQLNVGNGDGVVRVVGFRGGLAARTVDGEVFLDGDFTGIKANAASGRFVLTLPADADAEIRSAADRTELRGVTAANPRSGDVLTLGGGSRKYVFSSEDGSLLVQNREMIAVR